MKAVESLPNRPLTMEEIDVLNHSLDAERDEEGAAPLSGFPDHNSYYAVFFAKNGRYYALGLEPTTRNWMVVDEFDVDAEGGVNNAFQRVEEVINRWVQANYRHVTHETVNG